MQGVGLLPETMSLKARPRVRGLASTIELPESETAIVAPLAQSFS